jgi:hypothetical protein
MADFEDFKRGTECPDCGQEFTKPTGGEWQHDAEPHADSRDCIRHLREQLKRSLDALDRHNLL